jgi:hypothetical protein
MIGISRTLCYPQIGSPNLFCFRALDQICPLTKHIRLVGVCAFSGTFRGLELVPLKGVISPRPPAGNANRWAHSQNSFGRR